MEDQMDLYRYIMELTSGFEYCSTMCVHATRNFRVVDKCMTDDRDFFIEWLDSKDNFKHIQIANARIGCGGFENDEWDWDMMFDVFLDEDTQSVIPTTYIWTNKDKEYKTAIYDINDINNSFDYQIILFHLTKLLEEFKFKGYKVYETVTETTSADEFSQTTIITRKIPGDNFT